MVLLDTHVVIWLALEPKRLSRTAVRAVEKAREKDGLAIALVTLAEIANLVERGRVEIKISSESFLQSIASRFVLKHINVDIALLSSRFSDPYPGDPMDRIIGATALSEGLPLVTADERIRRSGQLQTIW